MDRVPFRGFAPAFVGAVLLFGVAVVVMAQRAPKAEELDPNLYAEEADRF